MRSLNGLEINAVSGGAYFDNDTIKYYWIWKSEFAITASGPPLGGEASTPSESTIQDYFYQLAQHLPNTDIAASEAAFGMSASNPGISQDLFYGMDSTVARFYESNTILGSYYVDRDGNGLIDGHFVADPTVARFNVDLDADNVAEIAAYIS